MTSGSNTKSRNFGRERRAARVRRGFVVACLFCARSGFADEVINDPELQGAGATAPAPAAKQTNSGGDAVITDPELAGTGTHPLKPDDEQPPPPPPDTIWRASIHTRWGIDTHWVAPPPPPATSTNQDIVQGTTVALLEAEQRRSESLMFSVGLRARQSVMRQRGGATFTQFYVEPVSGFVDVTPADGYHLRAGYQMVAMGRFDVFSASNFLAVYNLESGPVTMPEASAIAQPAVRFDFDRVRGFSLQAYYLPFFQPDRFTFYGSDYALLSPSTLGITDGYPTGSKAPIGLSQLANASTNAFSALGPAPDLTHPQGALRATLNGSVGELSATVGTALEHLPSISTNAAGTLGVDYGRYEVATVDGSADVGPLQIGAEVAYEANRTVGVTRTLNGAPPPAFPTQFCDQSGTPCVQAGSQTVNIVQGGLRAELVEAAGWAAEVEGFVLETLANPSNPAPPTGATATTKYEWFTMQNGRFWTGVAGGVHWAPETTHFRLELGALAFTGPTYVLMPRAEWEAVHTLFFEVGGAFVGGPTPALPLGSTMVSLGGLFSDVSQVFAGVRWTN